MDRQENTCKYMLVKTSFKLELEYIRWLDVDMYVDESNEASNIIKPPCQGKAMIFIDFLHAESEGAQLMPEMAVPRDVPLGRKCPGTQLVVTTFGEKWFETWLRYGWVPESW